MVLSGLAFNLMDVITALSGKPEVLKERNPRY
jgi:hypothetical protein